MDIVGFTASSGDIYWTGTPNHPTLYISEDNQVSFDTPIGQIYHAISGNLIFLLGGMPHGAELMASYHQAPHPRTAVALDQSGRMLMIFVVDGRQKGYSEGVSISELAEIIIEYGGYTAMNLDGGGSSALVMADEDGKPLVLNSPIHNHMPYRERPVANHLGIYSPAVGE